MIDTVLLRPTTTNVRRQDPDCVYHIYNRVAHSVRFLTDEAKDDLLDRIRRVSEFCGIKLLAWCLMTNHFHLLVYLPIPCELSRNEIKRRFGLLRPDERAIFFDGFILDRAPNELTKRMFNIGMMMKIVKENFTISYNERTGHRGTMWEGPYRFKKIPMEIGHLARSASYQNLNPVSACLTADFAGYEWTSFAAAAEGDLVALDGIDFVFGGYADRLEDRTNLSDKLVLGADGLLGMMRSQMEHDLGEIKMERAEELWRKRLAGGPILEDSLTSAALIAQVEARMMRFQSEEFQSELARLMGREAKNDEVKVVRVMVADPKSRTGTIARIAGLSKSRVKHISVLLQKFGIVRREGNLRTGVWRVDLPSASGTAA